MLAALFSVLALAATQSIAAPAIAARQDLAPSASESASASIDPSSASAGESGLAASSPASRPGREACHRKGNRLPRPSGSTTTVTDGAIPSASATLSASDSDSIPPISDDGSLAEPTGAPTSFVGDNNAAIVTSSAVTSSSASGPAASAAPAQDAGTGDAFADEILKLHNDFRAQYGAAPLTWNADAAAFAQSWASNCKFEHSQDSGYGENLAAGTGEGFDAAAGFSGWADEASLYDYNNPVFSAEAGHFTQVVWKGTTELGCALVDCPSGSLFSSSYNQVNRFLSCNYANTPGNYQGQFAENVGTKV